MYKPQLALLAQALDPKRIMTLAKGKQGVQTYLAAADCIDWANRIFGHGGWSTEVPQVLRSDVSDMANGHVVVTVVVAHRVHVHCEGLQASYGDIGCHTAQGPLGSDVVGDAYKAAVSDALKRCLRHLGDQFGLSLYLRERETLPAASGQPAAKGAKRDARRDVSQLWVELGWPSVREQPEVVMQVVRNVLGHPPGSERWSDFSQMQERHWALLYTWMQRVANAPEKWPEAFQSHAGVVF